MWCDWTIFVTNVSGELLSPGKSWCSPPYGPPTEGKCSAHQLAGGGDSHDAGVGNICSISR